MKKRNFSDTMIAAKDYKKLVDFYHKLVGLEIAEATDDYTMLVDKEKKQNLCISNGVSIKRTAPGIAVEDLEETLKDLENLGGKIEKRWELGPMKGANCMDPEGNWIMIWQGKHI
ncbi:VOC family protein [Elusimicrobiota bacterium]